MFCQSHGVTLLFQAGGEFDAVHPVVVDDEDVAVLGGHGVLHINA
jgi:hypothetical protein